MKVEYCSYTNTIFILFDNKTIKCYDLSPRDLKEGQPCTGKFVAGNLLLWEETLKYQPQSITCHPFACTLVIIYTGFIRFHNYNNKLLYSPFLVTTLKNCKLAQYSPLGDKLILATSGAIVVANSYTY